MRLNWLAMCRRLWTPWAQQLAARSGRKPRGRRETFHAAETMEVRLMLSATPTLTVVLASNSMSELAAGNGVTGTIQRTDADLSQAVTVSLSSSDSSEAVVPESITIAAGATSASFLVRPVDDNLLDGSQTLNITASAAGYEYSSVTVGGPAGFDSTFGSGGYSSTSLAWGLSNAYPDLVIQQDGKIVSFSQTPNSNNSWSLSRKLTTGANDTSFGTGGVVTTVFSSTNQVSPTSLALQSDGKILAAGHMAGGNTIWNDLTVVRYNTNGSLDTTFGTNGILRVERTTHTIINDMSILADGSILLAGAEGNRNFLTRLSPNGSFDSAFGSNGVVLTALPGINFSSVKSLMVQSDGAIVVGGTATPVGSNFANFFAARYLANGAVDTSFDLDGSVQIDTNSQSQSSGVLTSGVLQADGKIVLAGYDRPSSTANENWALVRLNSNGSLDTNFSGDGLVTLDFNGSADYANDVILQADGRLLVMGEAFVSGNGHDLAVARFNSDGTLDTTFDTDGKLVLPNWAGTIWEQIWAGELNSSNQLVFLAGYVNDMRVGRLNLNTPQPPRDGLTVTDFETLTVSIIPSSVSEGAGAGAVTGTVFRSNIADLSADLTVTLTSSDTTELTVPGTLVIPSGQNSATFAINAVDDTITDASQVVTITAIASGYISVTDTLTVTDDDTNVAPVATSQNISTSEDVAKSGTVTATDVDDSSLTFSLVSGPSHGQVTLNGSGAFVYTPTANYFGPDVFQFRAYDGQAFSNTASVSISVTAVNDAPVANNDSYVLDEDTTLITSLASQPVTRIQMTSDPGDWVGQGQTYNYSSNITAQAFNNGSYVRVNYQNPNNSSDYWTFEFESPFANVPLEVGTYQGATRYPFNPQGTPGLNVSGQHRGSNTLTGYFTIEQIVFNANGQLQNFKATFEQHSEGSPPALRGTVQYNYTTGLPAGVLANDTDVENNSLVAALVNGPQHGSVNLNSNGTFSYTPAANYYGNDSFTYVAGDGQLPSNVATVNLTVRSVEDAPSIVNQTFTVPENTQPLVSLGTVVASDGDTGQGIVFAITETTHPGTFAIDANTGELTVVDGTLLDHEQSPAAVLTVTVTDNGVPAISSSALITVQITDENDAPRIVTDALDVDENAANGTSLGTIVAVDQDVGQHLAFWLAFDISGGAFDVDAETGEVTVVNGALLNFEAIPEYTIGVSVVDDGNPVLSLTRNVTITVHDMNEAPDVFAQPMSIRENTADGVQVGSVHATDVDANQTPTFSIASSSLPGAFSIVPELGIILVADGSLLDYESVRWVDLTVAVTDDGNPALTTLYPVQISLIDENEAPFIAPSSFQIAENSANGTVVGLVVATDPDAGQSLTWTLADSSLPGVFAVNATTGRLTVANSSLLDYEQVQTVTLVVAVQDNGDPALFAWREIMVTITNVNDPPVIADRTFSVREYLNQGSVVGDVTATDPDAGQTLTWSITNTTLPDAFMIMPSSGRIVVANGNLLDYETVGAVTLTVRATDNGIPSQFSECTVTVNINDVNESPTMAAQSFSVAENAANGVVVGTVIAGDVDFGQALTYSLISSTVPGAFALNSATGQITVANGVLLNYESTTSVEIGVRAIDNGNPALATVAPITINLLNVNEAPVVTPVIFSLNENSANGVGVGTVNSTDPDAGQSQTFAITGGNTNNAFAINATTGVITVNNAAALNYEATPTFNLTVTATDDGLPALSGSATVTVNLLNVNEAPVVTPVIFSLNENSANGVAVGTVNSADPDAGQSQAFAITSGNTNSAFAINATTGIITVNNAAALNYEAAPTFNLTVTATDDGLPALSGSATVTVNLLNVNEAPVVTPVIFSLNENSANGVAVGTVISTDPDAGQNQTFAITSGNTNSAFAINAATGIITVNNAAALNYEATPTFNLTVTTTDNGSPALSGSATVTVNLLNVNDAPVVANQTFAVKTKSKAGAIVGTVVASDQDSSQTRTFAIVGGNGSANKPAFAINASTGVITVKTASSLNPSGQFSLSVRVTDNGSPALATTATMTIYVNSSGTIPAGAQSMLASQSDLSVTADDFTLESPSKKKSKSSYGLLIP